LLQLAECAGPSAVDCKHSKLRTGTRQGPQFADALAKILLPEASNAQNNMAAVSADGSTVCVLILRLNSSCSRSIALVVRALRH
jgi:hypothetical protein